MEDVSGQIGVGSLLQSKKGGLYLVMKDEISPEGWRVVKCQAMDGKWMHEPLLISVDAQRSQYFELRVAELAFYKWKVISKADQ